MKRMTSFLFTGILLLQYCVTVPNVFAETNNVEDSSQNLSENQDKNFEQVNNSSTEDFQTDTSLNESSVNVIIPDVTLRTKITQELGLSEGSEISEEQMLSLNYLEFDYNNGDEVVTSFEGLQYAKNLSGLVFNDYNNFGDDLVPIDVSYLAGLTELRNLKLDDLLLTNTISFNSFPKLVTISFMNTDINSIEFLSNSPLLKEIWATNNGISDISSLAHLENLETVAVGDNPLKDISALTNKQKLTHVELFGVGATTNLVEPLIGNTTIEYLELGNNVLENLDFAKGMKQLKTLIADTNQISDLSPLEGMDLDYFNGDNNHISDIQVFKNLNSPSVSINNQTIILPEQEISKNELMIENPIKGLENNIVYSNISNQGNYLLDNNQFKWENIPLGAGQQSFEFQEDFYFSGKVVQPYSYSIPKGSPVTVKYQDEIGNNISDEVILSGDLGEDYSTKQKDIEGYTFQKVIGNAMGQFTDQLQQVIYVYTAIEGASVTLKFVDEDGTLIAKEETLTGKLGSNYEAQAKQIEGYALKETPDNASGMFSEKEQVVTFEYEKINSNQPIVPPTNTDKEKPNSSSKLKYNENTSVLPQTGEYQSNLLWLVGGILMISGIYVFVRRWRKS